MDSQECDCKTDVKTETALSFMSNNGNNPTTQVFTPPVEAKATLMFDSKHENGFLGMARSPVENEVEQCIKNEPVELMEPLQADGHCSDNFSPDVKEEIELKYEIEWNDTELVNYIKKPAFLVVLILYFLHKM